MSISRRGNVYDNALAESFIKTLKYEEVCRTEYRSLADADSSQLQIRIESLMSWVSRQLWSRSTEREREVIALSCRGCLFTVILQ